MEDNYEESYDFVKYHEAAPDSSKSEIFRKAREFMQQSWGPNAQYSVHMFRRVIEPYQYDLNKIIDTSEGVYMYIDLRKTTIEGFYLNDKNYEAETNLINLKAILQRAPNREQLDFNEYARIVETYEDAVNDIAEKKKKIIYGMNLSASSLGMPTLLDNVPYHINPEKNFDINPSLGINIPTFYFGSDHSFTDIHVEDGYLDSTNLVHWGTPRSWKGWLVVDPKDNAKLNSLVLESIQKLQKKGDCKNFKCSTPMNHKNIFLSPKFLKMNDIRFQIIVQRPGDLVYVESMVYHQVINFGINLAEAVNVGSTKWNVAANHCIPCICPDNAITAIVKNSQSYEITKTKALIYRCEIGDCSATFSSKVRLDTHENQHLHSTSRKITCTKCNKLYKSQESLQKHILRMHVNTQPICSNCNQPQSAQNLQRHIRRCIVKEKECPYCKKIVKPLGMGPHKARCPKKTGDEYVKDKN